MSKWKGSGEKSMEPDLEPSEEEEEWREKVKRR